MDSTPEQQFDDWFSQTHGGTGETEIESDVDDMEEDNFDDPIDYNGL